MLVWFSTNFNFSTANEYCLRSANRDITQWNKIYVLIHYVL